MNATTRIFAVLGAAVALLATAAPSLARRGGDDNRVERSGSCSRGSDWTLKAKPGDGRIETELEVDQNRSGVHWKVKMRRDGRLIADVTRVTKPPSGSLEVSRRPSDRPGRDKIAAVAKRKGETCRGSLTI
jgi:hypothetical protein